jgi:disintegrin and metalloproteinase domain-containing protein 10
MRPHSQIFRPDVEFESVSKAGVKKINFDTREILKGYVQGVPGSSCHGRMSGEIFDGIVYANNETYFIEPAHRYFSTSQSFDGVIFKGSDVITDNPSHNKTNCAMTDWLYRKMKAIQESARPIETNNPSYRVGFQSEHVSYRRDTNTPALDTCNVLVAADYRFFTSVAGSSETNAISEISLHVDVANTVYRTTDFGFNFRPGLSIVKVRVYTDTSNEWDDSSLNVQSYLDRWSRINHDLFCLAMLFTYRDFSGGVLGLAWVGYPKASGTAGGICQKQARLTSGYRSLNTAIVTLLNFGERVPRAVSTITVAHEFGHNFGSEHDPETSECSPGSGRGGNYIMYARATDGDRPNNDEFSKCSIEQIAAVLESKAQQCFQPSKSSFCGNGITEGGEECDCGFKDECSTVDHCCTPQGGEGNDTECTFRSEKNAECSPKDGKCCTNDCKVKSPSNTPCEPATDCLSATYCNGINSSCPDQPPKSNAPPGGHLCDNNTKTCVDGLCSGSICSTINSTECFCNSPYLCRVCCQLPSSPGTCLPTSDPQLKSLNMDFRELYRPAGRSCQNYAGYCDAEGVCRGVDNNKVFETLNKVLFSSESLNWIKENWLVVVGIIAGIIFIIIMLRITYKKKKPIKNIARKALSRRKKDVADAAAKNKNERRANLARLKNMFPRAQDDTLKGVIRYCKNEEKAVERLLAMGFLMRRW